MKIPVMVNNMQQVKKPAGVIILSTFNLLILGITQIVTLLIPKNWSIIGNLLKEKGIDINLSSPLFKAIIAVQIIVSLVFILSGTGLLLRKEWARKLTVYFAFALCLLVLLTVLLSPSMIQQGILQIIYPGILIIYFTNKNVEQYFKQRNDK